MATADPDELASRKRRAIRTIVLGAVIGMTITSWTGGIVVFDMLAGASGCWRTECDPGNYVWIALASAVVSVVLVVGGTIALIRARHAISK